ncbi:hypothetical protein C8J56DRAFT_911500 [Mycena floridula]|nr:hypothetical protein C8J56DRAFT_911500 [Mycena floridula]
MLSSDDGDIFFLVENVTYRVRRVFFKQSGFFAPLLASELKEGSVDQPIALPFVSIVDFDRLLSVFHCSAKDLNHSKSGFVQHWTGVLHLARMWDFEQVAEVAKSQLKSSLTGAEQDSLFDYGEPDAVADDRCEKKRQTRKRSRSNDIENDSVDALVSCQTPGPRKVFRRLE